MTATKAAKQTFIPGTEPKKIPQIHNAIGRYVEARDERMEFTQKEVEKKATLLKAMKDNKIFDYNVDGHEAHVSIDETIKAKIKTEKEED